MHHHEGRIPAGAAYPASHRLLFGYIELTALIKVVRQLELNVDLTLFASGPNIFDLMR